ncbi:NAD-binding protein, partial [Belliella pelovolcani]|uniref:NAD-binding protein n=1 Tax=Belliella pelovolcani TaxID=529505 RepID=UPI003918AAA9
LAISILTMTVTPFVLKKRENLACGILDLPLPERLANRLANNDLPNIEIETDELKDHLVIIGFGLNGRNLAKAAKSANIPYAIIETNPETVKQESLKGEPIMYGDAANEAVLEHVNIHKARVAVIAISHPESTKRIIASIRHITQNPYIIVRTRYVGEMEANLKLGASEVIPEEFETSIEIFTRVLDKYLIPKHDIEEFTLDIRSDNYEMFRSLSPEGQSKFKIDLPQINFISLKVEKDSGDVINKSLKDAKIREKFGVNIVAIKRGNKTTAEITGEEKLKLGDIVYVVGKPANLEKFEEEIEID